MQRCLSTFLLLLTLSQFTDADEVWTMDRRGQTVRRKGTIVDYKGPELTLQTAGRDVTIASDAIQRLEADWLPVHVQADQLFEAKDYEQGLELYRAAFRNDPRRWVKRLLLSRVIRCQANTQRMDEACKNFSRLTADDPQTVYFASIPLAWKNRAAPAAVVKQVSPWLADNNRPANQLMAASWLLTGNSDRKILLRLLAELGRSAPDPIAKLAVSQMWRAELVSLKANRLDWCNSHVAAIPVDLRAGSYFLLGQSFAKHGDTQQAALAFLRVPTQFPHQRTIANASLLECGKLLLQAGRTDESKRCFSRLVEADAEEIQQAQSLLDRIKTGANP